MDSFQPPLPAPLRRFAEGQPKLEIHQLVRHGFDWVTFECATVDSSATVIEGAASASDDQILINWTDAGGTDHSALQPFLVAGHAQAPRKPQFVCLQCSRPRGTIYLVHQAWKCARCHKLRYLSQYITDYDRLRNEFLRLDSELRLGRKPYERAAKYAAKIARRQHLHETLTQMMYNPTHTGIVQRRVVTTYLDGEPKNQASR